MVAALVVVVVVAAVDVVVVVVVKVTKAFTPTRSPVVTRSKSQGSQL